MNVLALVLLAVALVVVPASAADRVRVFVFAAPDPALGGLVSQALLDSADDLKALIRRRWALGNARATNKREEATILVQVTGRSVVNEEYRVQVRVRCQTGARAT